MWSISSFKRSSDPVSLKYRGEQIIYYQGAHMAAEIWLRDYDYTAETMTFARKKDKNRYVWFRKLSCSKWMIEHTTESEEWRP